MRDLESATPFDLYRLRVAINQKLDDPDFINNIKRSLHLGMDIQYFDHEGNRLIDATVIKISRTRTLVKNKHDGHRWNIPFYMVNLEDVSVDILTPSNHGKLDRSQLKVGDHVGFVNRDNVELYGHIIKLNPKMAKVKLGDGKVWRVSYGCLFKTIEGLESNPLLLEAEVVTT